MRKIKNVIICGLGAIGTYYAYKLSKNQYLDFRVLIDKEREIRYKNEPRIFNGEKLNFEYILPDNNDYKADLIIISTKSYSLENVISNIKNFVTNNTIILSLLNGVTSEELIYKNYPKSKGLYSFALGHTYFRNENIIEHDGLSKIHFGSTIINDKRIDNLKELFNSCNISYELSENIISDMWKKYAFNCCVNQLSAITRYSFKEISENPKCLHIMKSLVEEIAMIAKRVGVKDSENFYEYTINSLKLMCPNGKTSMLQDIEAGRQTEVDIFGKTVVKLGKENKIDTTYNKIISELIDIL